MDYGINSPALLRSTAIGTVAQLAMVIGGHYSLAIANLFRRRGDGHFARGRRVVRSPGSPFDAPMCQDTRSGGLNDPGERGNRS